MMRGLDYEEIAKEANLKPKYISNLATGRAEGLVDNCGIKALVQQEQARIGALTEVNVASLQKDLLLKRDLATKEGKIATAIRCDELLLKTIGGFTADAPHQKTLESKQLEAKTRKELKQALESHLRAKYLAGGNDSPGNREIKPDQATRPVRTIPDDEVTVVDITDMQEDRNEVDI